MSRALNRRHAVASEHLWLALLLAVLRGLTSWRDVWQLSPGQRDACGGAPALAPCRHGIPGVDLGAGQRCPAPAGCPDLRGLPAGCAQLLVGKLAGLFDLRPQQWLCPQFRDDVLANCKVGVLLQRGVAPLPALGRLGRALGLIRPSTRLQGAGAVGGPVLDHARATASPAPTRDRPLCSA
jgi:hypothetical protein